MPRVTGLGHVGLYVRDLERMVGVYRDVMGMQVTKQNWRLGIVFLSADPEAVDHEIALMRGRPSADDPHLIQQISMRAASLDDLRAFHRRLRAEGYRIDNVVNHASATFGGTSVSLAPGTYALDFFSNAVVRTEQAAVPEASSLLLLASGLAGLGAAGWRYRRT